MKVFVSYGSQEDQVTALRLQALGAVNGLTIYVPPSYTRENGVPPPDAGPLDKLRQADFVWAVVERGLGDACRNELQLAADLRKSSVIMASPLYAQQLFPAFGASVVIADPAQPEQVVATIMQHLKTVDTQQNAKTALLALGAVALGLILFASADRS